MMAVGTEIGMHSSSLPGLANAKFWGFDSFQGMPDSPLHMIPPGILRDAGQRDDWSTGGFNAADILREHSWRPFQVRLKQNVLREDTCIRSPDLRLIRGFYNESLAEGATLARRLKMEPAWLIDIDCDLYSSTVEVLTPTLIPTPDPNLNHNPLPLPPTPDPNPNPNLTLTPTRCFASHSTRGFWFPVRTSTMMTSCTRTGRSTRRETTQRPSHRDYGPARTTSSARTRN